ncbi:SDR family NAD(P)-dependent oxidoreductase [Pseudomonas jinjuensis]|uniref:3alpha(Or 20beta)-hydroxysteroid dehydrogenase n=1 Tax=Pseudomonas jinjuensis TaxID=198616 RepID=A0A1H0D8K4_9PSED|nr:SDR family oxidoreductase [Pseudomonas jinjuensis]SDN66534.1 3alpha(or 20beta)-hydroxysteroid dehydrogenase [Pseudomonas jinjuensis]
MRMRDKNALVTGGASGMGLAFTRRLAQEGARVYFTDINEAAGRDAEKSLREAGLNVEFLQQDVTLEADWQRVLEHIEAADGHLCVLVNNAGIALSNHIENCTLEQFDKQINVNLKSVFLGCKFGLALMKEKGGSIRVNSLHPGYIETPMMANGSSGLETEELLALRNRLASEIPFKRRGTPAEVAGAVLYLASDDSVYVTGTEMIVDGGYACH